MPPLTFDTITARRELLEKRRELASVQDRLRRTEKTRESLLRVLSLIPDPIEVIGEDLLVQYANDASREFNGDNLEHTPYYESLLGQRSPDEDCPVILALREQREVKVESLIKGTKVEVSLTPTTLASGQPAVVRHSRRAQPAEPEREKTPDPTVDADVSADALELEAISETAIVAAHHLNTDVLIARILAIAARQLECKLALYYRLDDSARRLVRIAAGAEDAAPDILDGTDFVEFSNMLGMDAPYLLISDPSANSLPEPVKEHCKRCEVAEVLVVPTRTRLGRYGAFVLGRGQIEGSVVLEQDKFLNALGPITGSSIERNTVVAMLNNNVATATELQKAGLSIAATNNSETAVDLVARTAVEVLGFAAVQTRIISSNRHDTHPQGFTLQYPGNFTIDEPQSGEIAQSCSRVTERGEAELLSLDTTFRATVDQSHEYKLIRSRSVAVLPVDLHGGRRGVIMFFSEKTREELVALKPAIVLLVAHARLAIERSNAMTELQVAFGEAIGEGRTLAALLDTTADAAIVVDRRGEIIRTNVAFDNMVGLGTSYRPPISDILYPRATRPGDDIRATLFAGVTPAETFSEAFALAPTIEYECEIKTMDGSRIPVTLNSSALDNGAESCLLLTFRDNRSDNKIKFQLVEALNHYLAGRRIAPLARQVNSYLTPSFVHAEDLSKDDTLDESARRAAATILSYLDLCRGSIADILSFFGPAEPEMMNVNDLIDVILAKQYVVDELRQANVLVTQRYDSTMEPTIGYPLLLQQALANIIDNAREAIISAHDGGHITITTESTPATITVRVRDDGPGIPEPLRHRVFSPGVSTRRDAKGRGPEATSGRGIGLYFCREIVRKHRGHIDVECPDDGGTLFTIRIPVRSSDGVPTAAASTGLNTRTGTVLVIDDDQETLERLEEILTHAGHKVTSVGSASAALELIDRQSFDCAICDMKIPGMDVQSFSKRIRATHPSLYNRLVIATRDTYNPETADFLRKSGFRSVEKPFVAQTVQDAVVLALNTD